MLWIGCLVVLIIQLTCGTTATTTTTTATATATTATATATTATATATTATTTATATATTTATSTTAEHSPLTYVFVPSTLYLDQSNTIVVRTKHAATKMTLTLNLDNSLESLEDKTVYHLNRLDPNWYGIQVHYEFPFAIRDLSLVDNYIRPHLQFNFIHCLDLATCDEFSNVRVTKPITIGQLEWLVLGETDKPIYRPAELIQFRFITLNPVSLTLAQPNLSAKYNMTLGISNGKVRFEPLSQDELTNFQSPNIYREIVVQDPLGNTIHQWLKLDSVQASNLSFKLLTDAPEGNWKIVARIGRHQEEELQFKVKQYHLPRFTISIEQDQLLSTESKTFSFGVCAKYTNGQRMIGTIQSVLCVCYDQEWNEAWEKSPDKAANDLIESRTCPTNDGKQICIESVESLAKPNDCIRVHMDATQLNLNKSDYSLYWNKNSILCVKVAEDGTGSVQTQCESNQLSYYDVDDKMEPSLIIDAPSVYKNDLPIFVQVRLVNDTQLANRKLQIRVKERTNWCNFESTQDKAEFYYFPIETDANGQANFTLGPFDSKYSISIEASMAGSVSKATYENDKSFYGHYRQWCESTPAKPHATAYVKRWLALDGESLQVWPRNVIRLSDQCPNKVKLHLIANVPLKNATIFIEAISKVKHLLITVPPEAQTHDCQSTSNQFGHYYCDDSLQDAIQCLVGWTGPNCDRAICSDHCNKTYGFCLKPDQCLCKKGWSGPGCDECNPRPGCKHGTCVHGNDCVCRPNWQGCLCDVPTRQNDTNPIDQNDENDEVTENKPSMTLKSKVAKNALPTRTIFERMIEVELTDDWSPQVDAVIYINSNKNDYPYLVAAHVKFEHVSTCGPANSNEVQNSLKFDTNVVGPGQAVQLTIGRNVFSHEPEVDQSTCFVRISDKSLDNFQDQSSSPPITLTYLASLIDQLIGNKKMYLNPTSTEEAFEKAGLIVGSSYPVASISSPPIYCRSSFSLGLGPVSLSANPELQEFSASNDKRKHVLIKQRLRNFFPEVWLFTAVHPTITDQNDSPAVQLDLTAPDTITGWRASAYCNRQSLGLWMAQPTTLIVTMPFYITLTIPKQVKRGEHLHLPVSVFISDEHDVKNACYEIDLNLKIDSTEWNVIGPHSRMTCLCTGQKHTFLIGLVPQLLGKLNVQVEAVADPDSSICTTPKSIVGRKNKILADRVLRQIDVLPEGSRTELVISDLMCLSGLTVQRTHPIHLPSNVVPDSMHTYLSYSDEIIGSALKNLNDLVQLPTGCGEQNMVLVAPNIYALSYLKSVQRTDQAETQKLIAKIKRYVQIGYRKELEYRHPDGSFSAFGTTDPSGSTWLTAFVLSVFAKAHQIEPTLDIRWSDLFNASVTFLKAKQNPTNGCFAEQGRVLHSAMQGGLGRESRLGNVMLSIYVSLALNEANQINANEAIELGLKCVRDYLDEIDGGLETLDNYALNLLTYGWTKIKPKAELTQKLQKAMIERRKVILSFSVQHQYWSDCNQSDQPIDKNACDAARDVESTSYAYLALAAQNTMTTIELIPIIQWLVSKQNSQGGFYSTQDTILSLEAIANLATRLGLATNQQMPAQLTIKASFDHFDCKLEETIGQLQSNVLNQLECAQSDMTKVSQVTWQLDSTKPSQQCLIVQSAFVYNVPQAEIPDKMEIVKAVIVNKPLCSDKATHLTICVYPAKPNIDTGMILVQVGMVTGWQPDLEKITTQMGSSLQSLKKVTVRDRDNFVSLYFDGFTQSEFGGKLDEVQRCADVYLIQNVYVDEPQPAVISAQDYYIPESSITFNYTLDQCADQWNMKKKNKLTIETGEIYCVQCVVDETDTNPIIDQLIQTENNDKVYFFELVENDGLNKFEATVYGLAEGGSIDSWTASVEWAHSAQCPTCSIFKLNARLLYVSLELINPGQSLIEINTRNPGEQLIAIDNVLEILRANQKALTNQIFLKYIVNKFGN